MRFRPDTKIDNRIVAVYTVRDYQCTTVVQSGESMILTTVMYVVDKPTIDEACDTAIDYTRATISQIPE